MTIDGKEPAMEKRRKGRLPALLAAMAAVTLLLGSSSGAAVSSPREEAAEPAPAKRMAAAPRKTTGPRLPSAPEKASPEGTGTGALPCPIPETEAVEDTYFEGAVFLGDSRTEGLLLYSGLKTGHFYTAVGATVESVFSKDAWETEEGTKIPLLDAVAAQGSCDKIYVMLGINELGWTKTETFRDQYAKVIDRLREDHPDAKIVLQSIPPVSAKQEAKKTYVNTARIQVYNEVIQTLAQEKQCYFLDVAVCLTGTDGLLPEKLNFDGIHLNPSGCKVWLNYLRTHSLEDEAIAAARRKSS